MPKPPVTPTHLRAHLFEILDEILETGEPCEIIRGGKVLRIVPDVPRRLDLIELEKRLPKRNSLAPGVTYDDLVHMTWEFEPDTRFLP